MGEKIENSPTLLVVIKMHSLLEVILELNGVSKDNLERLCFNTMLKLNFK